MEKTTQRRSAPVRFLAFCWRLLTGIRVAVLNILFLFIVAIVLVAIFSKDQAPIPELAPLYIKFSGQLVDQFTYLSPQDQLINPSNGEQREMRVRDLVRVIDFAGHDNRINGLLLDLTQLKGGGISKMREIGEAIDRFKNSGKPVIAFADNYDQQQYFLATYADDISVHPMGRVAITGFGVYRNYYKEAIDKLAIDFHVFKVGQFKDFVEPYIRENMSDASRQHNNQWLNELWQEYTQHVESRRDLAEGALSQWINHMADHLAETEGDLAQMAVDMHLIDHSLSRVARHNLLLEKFGHAPDKPEELNVVSFERYRKEVIKPNDPFNKANVALVVAKGTILDGEQPEGTIGGDTLAKILRKVQRDENIKALVLRIDSGGGSAFASELIREEIQVLREKGVTVVVSMGSVAASGGYWIAMSADEIWATPSTITGSIGVFGLFPTLDRSLEKLGINTDGIGTTKLAGALRLDRPLDPEAANILQQGVESIYSRFLALVAQNRKRTPEQIHEVAQGRVWTGMRAKELGLVDQLGYLDDAITAAARRANLDNYQVKLFERDLSPQEALIREFMREAKVPATLAHVLENWSGMDLTALRIFVDAAGKAQANGFNAASHTYAACLMCVEL